jgi:hypothetical protein
VIGEAFRAQPLGQRLPVVEGVADPEALERFFVEAALREVCARAFGLVRIRQHLAIEGDGCLERFAQTPLASILARGPFGELDAGTFGEAAERLAEVEAVAPHEEGEDVAMLATTEAVPRLPVGCDDERRGLLGVERAEALHDRPGALERDRLTDDLGDGQLRLDLGDDA